MNKTKQMDGFKLVGEIVTLAHMVNSLTKYCVFVGFSGHVRTITVRITSSKKKYTETVVEGESYLPDKPDIDEADTEYIFTELNKIKYQLKKILRDNKIDYSQLNYETELVRHYKLT